MNWNLLSKYRSELMGIATISVVVFHFCEMVLDNLDHVNFLARQIGQSFLRHGYIGVEVFLILSGIGCYYSFCKKSNVKVFYKKRLVKIMIPYLLVAIPFWCCLNLFLEQKVKMFFLNLTGISLMMGTRTFWYVFLILIMYLIFPLLFYLFSQNGKRRIISFIIIEGLIILSTYILFLNYPNFFDSIEVLVTRIPIFIYGVYMGKNVREKKHISWLLFIFLISIMFFVNYDIENIILKRYVNSIQAIGFSLIIVKIFDILNIYQINLNSLNKKLSTIGMYSFEVYLIHIAYRKIFNELLIPTYTLLNYAIIIVLTIITSIVVKRVVNKINAKIYKLKED